MPVWYIVTASVSFLGILTAIVSTVGGVVALARGDYEETVGRWFVASVIGIAVMTIGALVIVFFGHVIA